VFLFERTNAVVSVNSAPVALVCYGRRRVRRKATAKLWRRREECGPDSEASCCARHSRLRGGYAGGAGRD